MTDDIHAHFILHSTTEFKPTVEFENDHMTTDAVAAIRVCSNDYSTFDVQDLRYLKYIQDMNHDIFSQTSTGIMPYLKTTYTAVPRPSN